MKTRYGLYANCLADLPYLQILRQGQNSSNKALPEFLFYEVSILLKIALKMSLTQRRKMKAEKESKSLESSWNEINVR